MAPQDDAAEDEAPQDEAGNVDYQAFTPKAAKMCYALLDWEVQRERQVAIQQLTEGGGGMGRGEAARRGN